MKAIKKSYNRKKQSMLKVIGSYRSQNPTRAISSFEYDKRKNGKSNKLSKYKPRLRQAEAEFRRAERKNQMKILVFSDSHGQSYNMKRAIDMHPDA